MANVKVSELSELTTPTSNLNDKFLLVTDASSGIPTSKKISFGTLDTLFDVSQNQANAAFNHANAAFSNSNTYITSAEAVNLTQNNSIVASFNHANASFNFSNVASNLALSFSATTILEVLNNGSGAYTFTQYGALNNPNVTTLSATTLGFKLNISGHPFHIRTGDNTADYSTGLVHVSTAGVLSYDSAAQGKESGTLFWRIPHSAVGNYKYRCASHPGSMIGEINIANTAAIYLTYNV